MSDLKGKIAVITGSAQGIGAGCARVMANHGADIVMVDISREGKSRGNHCKGRDLR